jgi:hypothetical protein
VKEERGLEREKERVEGERERERERDHLSGKFAERQQKCFHFC